MLNSIRVKHSPTFTDTVSCHISYSITDKCFWHIYTEEFNNDSQTMNRLIDKILIANPQPAIIRDMLECINSRLHASPPLNGTNRIQVLISQQMLHMIKPGPPKRHSTLG